MNINEKLNNIIQSRRIRNEIKKLNSIQDEDYCLCDIINENEILIVLLFENKVFDIRCKFPKDYPFSPPKIYLNRESYSKIIHKIPVKILKEIGIYDCLFCESLLCRNNWGPVCNLIMVLKEIQKNLILKRRVLDRIFCKYLIKQKYGHDYPPPIMDFL